MAKINWISDDEKRELEENEKKIARIEKLKHQLKETDYKIIKSYEYQLLNLELPYNVEKLHENRQAFRDKMNELE